MKILITSDTAAPSMDGPVHLPANSVADLEHAVAHAIVQAGKALYVDAKDDPTRRGALPGRWTASEAHVAAVRAGLRKSIPKPPPPESAT